MSSIRRLLARVLCFFRSNRAVSDLTREIGAHL